MGKMREGRGKGETKDRAREEGKGRGKRGRKGIPFRSMDIRDRGKMRTTYVVPKFPLLYDIKIILKHTKERAVCISLNRLAKFPLTS